MAALGELIVVNQFRIRSLRPAARRRIEFVREDAHGDGDGNALGVEIPFAKIFPVKTGAGKRRVRQPSDRDVVEDVVARKAFGLCLERRVRSTRSCARRDQGNTPRGRRANPRFRTTSAVAAPSGTRRRFPFDRRIADARKRASRRLRDPMAPARRRRPPHQCRPERRRACSYECRSIPEAPVRPI